MIGETAEALERLETLDDPRRGAQTAADRPVRIRVSACGVDLAFFHPSRPLPPYQLTIPHAQWVQMVQIVAEMAPRVADFEAFVGFTPESLNLHQIDAVEAHF